MGGGAPGVLPGGHWDLLLRPVLFNTGALPQDWPRRPQQGPAVSPADGEPPARHLASRHERASEHTARAREKVGAPDPRTISSERTTCLSQRSKVSNDRRKALRRSLVSQGPAGHQGPRGPGRHPAKAGDRFSGQCARPGGRERNPPGTAGQRAELHLTSCVFILFPNFFFFTRNTLPPFQVNYYFFPR